MCLRCVNAVVELYSDVKEDRTTGSRSYIGAFDRLDVPRNKDGKLELPGFAAVARFNFLGASEPEERQDGFAERKRGCLEVKLLLSECGGEPESRRASVLGEFEIGLAELEGSIKERASAS